MRCLDTCVHYIRGQVNEIQLRYDTADAGYSTLSFLGIKNSGGNPTNATVGKQAQLKCKRVPKCLRLNLVGDVSYLPKPGALKCGNVYGVNLWVNPDDNVRSGSWTMGWLVTKQLKPEGINMRILKNTLEMSFATQASFTTPE